MTFLLTFNCYGTHLPGDQRGWIDRNRGQAQGGPRAPCRALENHARLSMKRPAYSLTLDRANIVLQTMREVCEFRDWILLAAHVRTSHVHAVVDRVDAPNKTMADFKAYASRALNRLESNQTRWAREGSTRPLRTDHAIEAAIRYVVDGQGAPMAIYVARQRSPD